MKQLFEDLKNGSTFCLDVPLPSIAPHEVLIRTSTSLISLGTERMLVDFGKASWVGKALQQPERVRQVLDKITTDGILPTVQAVLSRIDSPLPLGYSQVGVVIERGARVPDIEVGDRVVSNGPHAEIVCVPETLVSKVPDVVSDEAASFTIVSAIGLQGIRLLQPELGETFAVIGLGLIGLLSAQILRANGCRVIAFDFDERRVALASAYGIEAVAIHSDDQPVRAACDFTSNRGVDGVLITAATSNNAPVSQAARMCRKRGRIVLVGVTGLELNRTEFYEKELSFQVSCSYGPGRYDPAYESKGIDYPIGFVRWTARRNFSAVLELMERGLIDVSSLISARIPFDEAPSFYAERISDPEIIGCLIQYPKNPSVDRVIRKTDFNSAPDDSPVIGVIGSGSFTKAVVLPAFAKTKARIKAIASRKGASAAILAKKFDIPICTTDVSAIFTDPEIRGVVIATRHDLHAELVCQALEAGKHVFVEKPLCVTKLEEERIKEVHARHSELTLTVGFNRRFSPLIMNAKKLLEGRQGPLAMTMTVNAGDLPDAHWAKDPVEGGGRIKGEACHFEDLLAYLAESEPVERVEMHAERSGTAVEDICSISLRFADGSIGTIQYFANGNKRWPKEDLLVFSDGRVLRIDNFKKLTGEGFGRRINLRLWRQDKGHQQELEAWVESL